MFALACLYFQQNILDHWPYSKAGVGSRDDPVRLVGALCTCVTSVDYEHVELLGHSLELIVSDKSDTCAARGTIVYGENCRSLRPDIIEYNRYREVTTLFVREQIAIGNEFPLGGRTALRPTVRGLRFSLPRNKLPGAFQISNAAIAVTLFLLWLRRIAAWRSPLPKPKPA